MQAPYGSWGYGSKRDRVPGPWSFRAGGGRRSANIKQTQKMILGGDKYCKGDQMGGGKGRVRGQVTGSR